jgi:hypothetical protein
MVNWGLYWAYAGGLAGVMACGTVVCALVVRAWRSG